LFLEYSKQYNTDVEIIIPIVFPEAIRYSIIKDYLETKSLELTYVYISLYFYEKDLPEILSK